MCISVDQTLEVFQDSFHSFFNFGDQKCKNQCFGEKIILSTFYQIEMKVFTNWFR